MTPLVLVLEVFVFLLSFVESLLNDKNDKKIIKVYAIAEAGTTVTTQSIRYGHQIAIDEINNDPNILANYVLQYEQLQPDGGYTSTLELSVKISQLYSQCGDKQYILSPIILGIVYVIILWIYCYLMLFIYILM